MTRIAVTGGTGFIGRQVIAYLVSMGYDLEVVVCGRNQEKLDKLQSRFGIKTVCFDLSDSVEGAFEMMGQPDFLIHLAWDGLDCYKDAIHYEKYLLQHYCFLRGVIEDGLSNLTVAGTCFEYGLASGLLQEKDPALPVTAYGLAKDCLHRFLCALQGEYSFSLKWLRYFYMYGEGQNHRALLSLLDVAIDRGDSVFDMSGGEQLRDFMPVELVAEYTVRAVFQQKVRGAINICSGEPVSIRRLVENRIEERNASIELNLGYYPYPDYETMAFWGDNAKLRCFIDD